MIKTMDENIGRLVKTLKQLDLEEKYNYCLYFR